MSNKTYPNLAGDDWFVRDSVKEELSIKLTAISAFLISHNIDYEVDIAGVAEALTTHIDATEYTHDEIEFVVKNIQFSTALLELREDGLIELTEDGEYRLL